MFPRTIVVIALCALTTALPAPADRSSVLVVNHNVEDGSLYSSLPLFQVFKPIIDMFPNFSDIGPKIEVGDKYTNIIVKAKDYKLEDLSVKIKGKLVVLQGSRKSEAGDRDLTSEFLYTTSLPNNINSQEVFAKYYSDGYLVVTSPNEGQKGFYEDRSVPIVYTEELFIKPKPVKPVSPVENVNVKPVAPVEPVAPVKAPVASDVPVVPEVPVPVAAEESKVPVPEVPVEVVKPAPVAPVIPEVPVAPVVPEVPVSPVVPEVPISSAVPDVPLAPVVPEVPVAPVSPVVQEVPATESQPEIEEIRGTVDYFQGTTQAEPESTAQPTVVPEVQEDKTSQDEKEVESTTPYIEALAVETTPFVANEISDLEPSSEQ